MHINTNGRGEWRASIAILLSLGFVWHKSSDNLTDLDSIEKRFYPNYPHIDIHTREKSISGNMSPYSRGLNIITDGPTILGKLIETTEIAVKDIAGFDGVVHIGKVVVGCQTITLEKFREIEAAAKLIRGN